MGGASPGLEGGLTSSPLWFWRGGVPCAPSPLVGGVSGRPPRRESSGAFDNLLGPRDPPPIGRSGERPSLGRAMPAPTRGGGCANAIDSAEYQQALSHCPGLGDHAETLPRVDFVPERAPPPLVVEIPAHRLLNPALESFVRTPAELAFELGGVDRVAEIVPRPVG